MKKYIFLFVVLLYFAQAQSCLNCRPNSCNNGVCTQCQSGFMLSNQGWCGIFTPIQECRVYDALQNNRCVACNPDRDLINQRCYQRPENCRSADIFRQCIECNPNFQLQKGKCYSKNINQCSSGSLPVSGFCQPLRPQNCMDLNADMLCLRCDIGYTLINSRCLRVTRQSQCPSNSCSCPNGFIFNNNCYQVLIDKCTLKRDAVYCQACERGFVAIDGICLQPVKQDDINCNVLAPLSDYCSGCNQDYFLNIDAFCYRNFNMTVCPVATGLFYLQNGKCLYWDRRCDTIDMLNQTYRCLRCQQGFTLTSKGCQRNICTRFATNGTCIEVFVGYQLVAGAVNQYIQLPTNCLIYDSVAQRCTQCSSFTTLLPMTMNAGSDFVCAYEDKNCIEYNRNGSCIKCLNELDINGFVLRDRFCFQKAQNCIARDLTDQSKCTQCQSGYHLDRVERICYADVDGCEIYISKSDCKQCASGYILSNFKCFPTNLECLDFDSNNMCRRCGLGLMPFKNICVYYHPYCLQYGVDRVCSRAAGGWILGNGMNQAQKDYYQAFIVRGQQVKSRAGQVDISGLNGGSGAGAYSSGALITKFPYANVLHSKISSINILGQVVGCNLGYTLVNQACILKITQNCDLYNQDEICIRCKPNYTLNSDFTCVAGLQCAAQDISNGRCTKCPPNFINVGVNCFRIDGQALIDQQLQSAAFYKYSFSNGSYMAWPRLSNCRVQSNPAACSQCIPPYKLTEGACIIPVERCIDYGYTRGQNPGICLVCASGFTYWFGQCRRLQCSAVNFLCQTCPTNFYYYFGICLSSSQTNCRSNQNGVCLNCNPGFYLSLQNQCLAEVAQCLTTNRDTGRCLECRSGRVLYRQRCVNQINYCQDYDANNRCIRCQQNTVNRTQLLSDGTCAFLEGQCARVNQNTKQCAECNLGYNPISQDGRILCVVTRTNCLVYDIRGRCITCNKGYILRNNQCVMYIQFCLEYTLNQQQCVKCADGTQLYNGCCRYKDPNCINTNAQCICTTCLTGNFLNQNGLCQQNLIPGCDVYDMLTGRCIKCSNLFYLLLNGRCLHRDNIVNGCEEGFNLTYGQSVGYQCLKCSPGFQLNMTDKLCYGYNCLNYHPSTRQCVSCPPYYQIFQGTNGNLNYCIPYFCDSYIPGQNQCSRNSSTYYGGHIIIVTTKTVTITYCQQVEASTGKCLTCSNYRYPNQNTLYNLCYPFNCASSIQFNCLKCNFGYGFDSRFPGSCVASFCAQFKNDGSCRACVTPYTLSSSGICENKGCCDVYDNVNNVCRTPKKYFLLQNNICTPVNCLSTDPARIQRCTQCIGIGYTLFPDGTCRVSNCQQESTGGDSCVVCNPGFTPQYSVTSAKSICIPRYCAQSAADLNTCLRCLDGFELDVNKLCRARFCAVFQSSLVCQTCNPYFILKNQLCIADCSIGNSTSCKCCNYGFTLNVTTNLCQPTSSFCSRKSQTSGLCTECFAPHNLITGQCIAPVRNCRNISLFGCSSCDIGYVMKDSCRCEPRNCIRVADNNTCIECHQRFQLVNGLCKARDCSNFVTSTWTCNGCYGRFSYVDGVCVTNDCQLWGDIESTICSKCKVATFLSNSDFTLTVASEYNLTYGACYIKYCLNDPRDFYCKQCIPGFKVTMNGLCQCQDTDPITKKCNCPKGYVFNSNTGGCQINRDICLQRDQKGVCVQCPYQYQQPGSNGGQCIPIYCQKWEQTFPQYFECRQCYPNFKLVNGFCESTLCQKFEKKDGLLFPQCTLCQKGYIPISNFCIPVRCQPKTYDLKLAQCLQCNSFGYILSPDKSRCLVANCQIDLLPDQCQKCKYGYYNFTGLCIATNCTLFDGVTCKGCDSNFILKDELCYARNCEKYADNNLCLQCKNGFKLYPNMTCLRVFCQFDSPDRCLLCERGYIFNATLQKCIPTNCQRYNENYDACIDCLPGLNKENGTCMDIRCDINSFDRFYKCLVCANLYQFNKDGLCYPKDLDFCPPGRYYNETVKACVVIPIPDCRFYVNKKCVWCADDYFLFGELCYSIRFCTKYSYFFGCSECVQGYYLEGRQCKKQEAPTNCLQVQANRCLKCNSGYQLINGFCIQIPKDCLKVDASGKCITCASGFFADKNGNCLSSDLNCLYFTPQGQCGQCRQNFYINSNGMCEQNPANCKVATLSNACVQCNIGFSLQNGRCYRSYDNCGKYSQVTEFCIECLNGFRLSGVECRCDLGNQIINKQCVKLPENCLELNPATLQCLRCRADFSLTFDFRCVSGNNNIAPANCNIYNSTTGICVECFEGYSLVNNQCTTCSKEYILIGDACYLIIIGCRTYLNNGFCQICADGYLLQNNKCVAIKSPLFCSQYDPKTGICQKCIDGYNLAANKSCVLSNCLVPSTDGLSCVQCIDSFAWTGKQCRSDTEFCLSYAYGKCISCQPFASFNQSRCVPNFCSVYDYIRGFCTSCVSGYQLLNRRCYILIIGCQEYFQTAQQAGLCRTCLPGYMLSNNQCIKQSQINFCLKYNTTNSLCISCAPGYTLTPDGKLCKLTNCDIMQASGLVCNKCLSPFQWNGQMCVFITDFCLSYFNGYCNACTNWSVLGRNRCVPFNCTNYNYNTGVCQACASGYNLSLPNKRCFLRIAFCISYLDTGFCSQCQNGYTLSNNGASCIQNQKPLIPSCYAQSAQTCLRCRHRYYTDSSMCLAYQPYCINVQPLQGKCISCCFGSTLVNGSCRRNQAIKYCTRQVGNKCQQCQNGYNYCDFCQACLPASANCKTYNRDYPQECIECFDNFINTNGVCVAMPVGFVLGAVGTCRSGYYLKDGNCYRNANQLSSASSKGYITEISPDNNYIRTTNPRIGSEPLLIFTIEIKSTTRTLNNSFLLYYRSKQDDPFICWNSCIPTKIENQQYRKDLVHPIVATEVNVYFVNQKVTDFNVQFKVL